MDPFTFGGPVEADLRGLRAAARAAATPARTRAACCARIPATSAATRPVTWFPSQPGGSGPMIILVLRSPPGTHPIFKDLTARERQVAGLIADGLGNRQIAAALVDTVNTVDKHVRRILAKTGLSGRAAMVALWHTGTVHGDVG